MLQSIKTPDGKIVSFEYDALGRRTAKIGKDEINRYLWDGNVLLHEWQYNPVERPMPTKDELGVLKVKNQEPTRDVVTWVYEEGSYVPSAKLVNNERYSIVSDFNPMSIY